MESQLRNHLSVSSAFWQWLSSRRRHLFRHSTQNRRESTEDRRKGQHASVAGVHQCIGRDDSRRCERKIDSSLA
jgi:hypothetical protein